MGESYPADATEQNIQHSLIRKKNNAATLSMIARNRFVTLDKRSGEYCLDLTGGVRPSVTLCLYGTLILDQLGKWHQLNIVSL